MQDSKWQLRMFPDMFILEDSVRLEPILITGKDYRRKQLRGYQQYQRFISRIVSDTTNFIDRSRIEIFIERNMRQLHSYKRDTTFISDEEFYSSIGVSEEQVKEHYTHRLFQRVNDWLKTQSDRVYRLYVKSPILTEGIRLDTVVVNENGDFTYNLCRPSTPGLV